MMTGWSLALRISKNTSWSHYPCPQYLQFRSIYWCVVFRIMWMFNMKNGGACMKDIQKDNNPRWTKTEPFLEWWKSLRGFVYFWVMVVFRFWRCNLTKSQAMKTYMSSIKGMWHWANIHGMKNAATCSDIHSEILWIWWNWTSKSSSLPRNRSLGIFFLGSKFPHKKNPETSRWKAPELVMRSRARCDLGDPMGCEDAKVGAFEPRFFLDIEVWWSRWLSNMGWGSLRSYGELPQSVCWYPFSFFGGGVFPVVKLYYVGTLFLKVSLGWKPKNLTFVVPKLCFLKAGYLKEICSRSLRIWRTWDLPNVEFWGILQTIKQGEDSERRKAALKAEKRFANERLKRGKYAQKAFPFASLEDDSKMLAPQRHATDWGRWTW